MTTGKEYLNTHPYSATSQKTSSEITERILRKSWNESGKYKSLESVFGELSPKNWKKLLFDSNKNVFREDCPTMNDFIAIYGFEQGEKFIQTQMFDCYGLTNGQDSLVSRQINSFAGIFCSFAKYSKMNEIALFFGRYSTGAYDRKANFSTRELGLSWRKFLNDWANESQGYANMEDDGTKPAQPTLVRKNNYERYLRTKFYAENDPRPQVRETCQKLLESTLTKDGIVPLLNYGQRKSAEEHLDRVFAEDDAKGRRFSVVRDNGAISGVSGYYQHT